MGQEQITSARNSLAAVISAMSAGGRPCALVMVDGNLVMPSAPCPAVWTEVRLKTAAGMITVRRRGDDVALMVFGNASPELLAARAEIATAFATARPPVGR